jgi:AcrR family transcriptional regulator
MDDVADRAGVGRMTVYRRFGSRQQLEEALAVREARRCLAELDSTIDPGAPVADQIAQGLLTSLRLIREHPMLERMSRIEPAAALAALTSEGAAVFAMSRAFVAGRLIESQRRGQIDPEIDPEQAAEMLVRIALSFLLIPQSALPLDDDERMRELARTLIAPILGGEHAR